MKDKVVLITGGTSGIGLKAAELFLEKGASVAIVGRNGEKGVTVVDSLKGKFPAAKIEFFQGDVSQVADCEKAVRETIKRFLHLDVLVNSAGIYFEKAIEDMSEADYSQIMDTNLKGTYFMAKSALPELKKRQGSSIINVSSDAGLQGNYLCSAYCASKGAVTIFTKALALEAAPYGVRVNCVCPGDIMTPLTERQLQNEPSREMALKEMSAVYPLGRVGTAFEAASVIVFLSSEAAGFVTGAAWSVDGGITA